MAEVLRARRTYQNPRGGYFGIRWMSDDSFDVESHTSDGGWIKVSPTGNFGEVTLQVHSSWHTPEWQKEAKRARGECAEHDCRHDVRVYYDDLVKVMKLIRPFYEDPD